MSAAVAGALTCLPGLCFGLVGALAVGFALLAHREALNLASGLLVILFGLFSFIEARYRRIEDPEVIERAADEVRSRLPST